MSANVKYVPLLVVQIILMALYFIFVRYGGEKYHDLRGFEGTHVMIFIGFGFLMTFLRKYAYSALGYNWFLAALVVQWALLCQSFYHMKDNTIYLTKHTILEADIMAATVLITFGAVLGLTSGLQLLFISIIEVAFACLNFWIVADIFQAADIGGSIAIHAFGAYFGLGVSWAINNNRGPPPAPPSSSWFGSGNQTTTGTNTPKGDLSGPSYNSDITAMIGSLFLWIYWPSFNSGLSKSNTEYQRAIVNTYLSLASATVTTFVMSSLVSRHHGRFDMVHVQNSTLAGGVAVGSVCNMFIGAGGAIAVGMGAGFLSVMGYTYLTPYLNKMGILDTCGVNNLHGMPGIYSGLLSVLFAAMATKAEYGDDYGIVFSAMGGGGAGLREGDAPPPPPNPPAGGGSPAAAGISPSQQAYNQLYALLVTFGISVVGGAITGFLAKSPCLEPLKENEKYDDEVNWELPN